MSNERYTPSQIQEAINAVRPLGIRGETLMHPPDNNAIPPEQQFRLRRPGEVADPFEKLTTGQKMFYALGLTTAPSRFVAVTAATFIALEIVHPFEIETKDDRLERLGLSLVAGGVASIFF